MKQTYKARQAFRSHLSFFTNEAVQLTRVPYFSRMFSGLVALVRPPLLVYAERLCYRRTGVNHLIRCRVCTSAETVLREGTRSSAEILQRRERNSRRSSWAWLQLTLFHISPFHARFVTSPRVCWSIYRHRYV